MKSKPRELDVCQRHQRKIALATLRMSDVGAAIMGGMTKDDARAFLRGIGYAAAAIAKLESTP